MKFYQKIAICFLQNCLVQNTFCFIPKIDTNTPKIHAQTPEINDLLESLTRIDSKIDAQKKWIKKKRQNNKNEEDKGRDKFISQNILNSDIDISYLTNKLQKIVEIPLDKDLIRCELIQVKQHYILMTEIAVNQLFVAVYKRKIEFFDLGGNLVKQIFTRYEIINFKESLASENRKSLDIFTSDLKIYSYNLITHAYTEKKAKTQLKQIKEKQFLTTTLDIKMVLKSTIDVLMALDMGIVPFTYFVNKKLFIDFTEMETTILRKTRHFYLGDSQGNVYHIGNDEKLKGKLSLDKVSNQPNEPILQLYAINPYNALVTPKGLCFFAPYSMVKTIDCREDIGDSIVATAVSNQQMNLYFLITARGVVYVKYIKTGSCLSAAKLLLKSKKIYLPKIIIVKNMIVIIPNSLQSNDVEIFDIKNITKLKQSSPYGLQAKIPDLMQFSDDTKIYKFKENSLLVTQTYGSKAHIFYQGIKLDEESDFTSFLKLPWVLIMFGVAIVYNLVFRKAKESPYAKKYGTESNRGPQSSDLNKTWKAGKSAYKSGKKF